MRIRICVRYRLYKPDFEEDIMRIDGRQADQIRPVKVELDYTMHAEGSVLISMGQTKVICTASIEERVPPFLRGQGRKKKE